MKDRRANKHNERRALEEQPRFHAQQRSYQKLKRTELNLSLNDIASL